MFKGRLEQCKLRYPQTVDGILGNKLEEERAAHEGSRATHRGASEQLREDLQSARDAVNALKDEGAGSVVAYVDHGVLSGGAAARVASSALERLVVTDSIQLTEAVRIAENIYVLSIAGLMGEAARRISDETSVSSLFD